MDLNFVPELLSLLPLSGALFLVWREHQRLRSLTPFIFGIVLLFIARLSDVVIQLPTDFGAMFVGFGKATVDRILNGVSDFCDTTGVFLLVAGFVQTIRYERQEKRRVDILEAILPLCAWCKNYRTERGKWLPIERYIIEEGRNITHGICPSCVERYFQPDRDESP